jgi:hypothetical protein
MSSTLSTEARGILKLDRRGKKREIYRESERATAKGYDGYGGRGGWRCRGDP